MLSTGTRSFALAGLCLMLGGPLAAQQAFRADQVPRSVRFGRDSLFQATVIAHRVLQVRAELDTTPVAGRQARPRLTGRYAVYDVRPNRTRLIASRNVAASDAPTIAFISHGDPAVVVLSSYTGGTGRGAVENYSFKVIVAEAEQFRAYTIEPDSGRTFASADIKGFDRGPTGSFTLRFADGPSVRYRDGRLSLSTSGADR